MPIRRLLTYAERWIAPAHGVCISTRTARRVCSPGLEWFGSSQAFPTLGLASGTRALSRAGLARACPSLPAYASAGEGHRGLAIPSQAHIADSLCTVAARPNWAVCTSYCLTHYACAQRQPSVCTNILVRKHTLTCLQWLEVCFPQTYSRQAPHWAVTSRQTLTCLQSNLPTL